MDGKELTVDNKRGQSSNPEKYEAVSDLEVGEQRNGEMSPRNI